MKNKYKNNFKQYLFVLLEWNKIKKERQKPARLNQDNEKTADQEAWCETSRQPRQVVRDPNFQYSREPRLLDFVSLCEETDNRIAMLHLLRIILAN